MKFRAFFAAAVLAAGLGQAAQAATVGAGKYTVSITVQEHYFDCKSVCPDEVELPVASDYRSLVKGQTVKGYIELFHLGSIADPDESIRFVLSYRDQQIMKYLDKVDEQSYIHPTGCCDSLDFWPGTGMRSGRLTMVDYWMVGGFDEYVAIDLTDIAPVPLPAGAALLPVGLGALALMRKRRRTRQ